MKIFVHSGFVKTCDELVISLVKSSSKYYDDCGKILGNMILRIMSPKLNIPWHMPFQLDDPPIVPTTVGKMMELRYELKVSLFQNEILVSKIFQNCNEKL